MLIIILIFSNNSILILIPIIIAINFIFFSETLRLEIYRLPGYERVHLPLCKVTDAPFHIQGTRYCTLLSTIQYNNQNNWKSAPHPSSPRQQVFSETICPLDLKGCICHFGKWQIHPFISEECVASHTYVRVSSPPSSPLQSMSGTTSTKTLFILRDWEEFRFYSIFLSSPFPVIDCTRLNPHNSPFSAGFDFSRQNLTSKIDPRTK